MFHQVKARIDPALVAVLLIALIAALPLLTRPGLPRHTDLELHVFRAAEYRSLLAERPLEYPRWAPDFYYGYGYPIFNYYAPLTYLAASAITVIPGVGVVGAVKAVLLLVFLLAASGAFLLARRHAGSTGGVIAAAAYVFSPYLLFIDPFMRGDAAEFLALGILPWVFLAFDRPPSSARDVALAALALAALVFSHNLMALIGAALLVAWLVWRGLLVDGVGRWPRDGLALALAAGLTAIFWLPFFAERGAVRLDVAGPGHFDFRNHFVEIGALLRPSPTLDLGATTPHFIYNLGLAQWVLALPVLLALRHARRLESRAALFFPIASLLLIFLITPASRLLWEAVPSAALIQFPWRLLGPAALALAMCASCGVSALPRPSLAGAAALALVLAFALPTMYPPSWLADFGDASPRGAIDFELSGVALGTTSTGDFLPVTVSQAPPPAAYLLDQYRAGSFIDRFDYASAAGARVYLIRPGDLAAEYSIESTDGFTPRFFVFDFPGWQAYVDGEPVPHRPSRGDGFIQFDVPASARTFGVRFGSTPARTAGSLASLVSLAAMVGLAVVRSRRAPTPTPYSGANFNLSLVLLAFLLAKLIVFDHCANCFRFTSPPGQALAATNAQPANFGGHIALLGFDLPRAEVTPGETIPLTLYWRATAPVPTNYQVFAHLTRPPHILWGQSDKLNPGDFPSTRWPLDKYVWDDHTIRVLPGTPPGEYAIVAGLYTLGDGRRAPVLDAAGNIVADSVQLSLTVRVARAAAPPAFDSLGIQARLDRREGDLLLLGASIEQTVLARPNYARLTLFWQALADAPSGVTVRARLLDQADRVAAEIVTSPTGGAYPTSDWRAGEVVRDVYAFWLPPDFAPGAYALRAEIERETGQAGPPIDLGSIEVTD
jgi:hypothetical protein